MQIERVAWLGIAMAMLASLAAAQDSQPTWHLPTSTPREVGLDPKALANFDADIASGKYGYVDSMLVIRYGKVVYDRSYNHDYDHIYASSHDITGQETLGTGLLHDRLRHYGRSRMANHDCGENFRIWKFFRALGRVPVRAALRQGLLPLRAPRSGPALVTPQRFRMATVYAGACARICQFCQCAQGPQPRQRPLVSSRSWDPSEKLLPVTADAAGGRNRTHV